MSYGETVNYIVSLGRKRIPNLVNETKRLAEALGSPQQSYHIIHVTGTCGKGSVSTQCANVLYHSGYKTGLMTSPHIIDYKERFQVNFQYISEDYVISKVEEIKQVASANEISLSFSIINTVLGLSYFRDMGVDFAVLEVGAGGTSDTTNIVNPCVSIITSVGLDHCHIFGNTIEDIATEKSGVIKPGKPCVIGPNTPHELLQKLATEKGGEMVVTQSDPTDGFIMENKRITQTVAGVLMNIGHSLNEQAIELSLYARPPLRFQEVCIGNSKIILDVAHNALALEKVLNEASKKFPQRLNVVLGVANHKPPHEFIAKVASHCDSIYLASWEHSMLMPIQELDRVGREMCPDKIVKAGEVRNVIEDIMRENKDELFVVCGSFFLLEGVVKELRDLGVQVELTWKVNG